MISATVITLNEETNITTLLKNLEGFADEIIVVDCGSTDKTIELAKKITPFVFFRKFDNFANQKNWAVSKASNEWILSVDADEQIPELLKQEILKTIKNEQYNGYLIPRRNFILDREIKHSRWSPDKHIWLWRKDHGKWVGDVHEEVKVSGKVGELKNNKIHNSHKTISEFFESNNFYSSILAQSMHKKNIRFSFLKMFWDPIFEFFVRYFYKLGFLDGWRGFTLSFLMAIYQLIVWVKVWEQEQRK